MPSPADPWTWFAPEGLSATWREVLQGAGAQGSEDPNRWDLWLPSRGLALDRQLRELPPPRPGSVVGALPGAGVLADKRLLWVRLVLALGRTGAARIAPQAWLPELPRDLDALRAHAARGGGPWVLKDVRRQRREGVRLTDDPLSLLPADPAERRRMLVQEGVRDVLSIDGHRTSLRVWLVLRREGRGLTAWRHREGLVVYAPSKDDWMTRTTADWLAPVGAPRRLSGLIRGLGAPARAVPAAIDAALRAACGAALRDLGKAEALRSTPCFELFGVDFVLDASLHPWLVEFNRKPRTAPREPDEAPLRAEILRGALALGGVGGVEGGENCCELGRWRLPDG